MATGSISCTIPKDANYPNLKEVSLPQMRREVADLFAPGEEAVQCFQTIRDQVVFTNKRVFIVNVQGVTGKKDSYFSYPYSKVQYFGIEMAGILDADSELLLVFCDGNQLQFDFRSRVDIKRICANISAYIL